MSRWVSVIDADVTARPRGLWTEVCDLVTAGTILRITVPDLKGSEIPLWSYSDAGECPPDGDPMSLIGRARCLCDKAPVGALIGKLGGSTAGAADGIVFVVGSSCVVKVGGDDVPLYLTINDEESGMSNNQGNLKVKIEQRLA